MDSEGPLPPRPRLGLVAPESWQGCIPLWFCMRMVKIATYSNGSVTGRAQGGSLTCSGSQ